MTQRVRVAQRVRVSQRDRFTQRVRVWGCKVRDSSHCPPL